MANIYSTETVYLYTTVIGGLQPYDQCARWSGGWTASNGTTGILQVGATPSNIPYINSTNTPCLSPGTSGGSLTGTLIPNGFTGSISVWVDVADSSGVFKESNTKTYTVEPVGALVVNAGPDRAINGVGPNYLTITGAGVTGGVPPYTYLWTQSYPSGSVPPGDPVNPERTYFTPGPAPLYETSTALLPDMEEFNSNGTYNFKLTVTDNSGQTGTDSMQVTVTGATPPVVAPSTDNIIWETLRTEPGSEGASLVFNIKRNGSPVVTNIGSASGVSNGWSSGQNIGGGAGTIFGGSTGPSTVYVTWTIYRQSRIAPYATSLVATYYDCANSGANVTAASVPYNPGFQYQIYAESGFC